MSDAFTAASRDATRSDKVEIYLETLFEYLKGDRNHQELAQAEAEADSVRGGWGGRTEFTKKSHQDLVNNLQEGKEDAWVQFLFLLGGDKLFQNFKSISPFKGKTLLKAKCDSWSIPTLSGADALKILSRLFPDQYMAHQEYLIVLDESSLEGIKGFHLNNPEIN